MRDRFLDNCRLWLVFLMSLHYGGAASRLHSDHSWQIVDFAKSFEFFEAFPDRICRAATAHGDNEPIGHSELLRNFKRNRLLTLNREGIQLCRGLIPASFVLQ